MGNYHIGAMVGRYREFRRNKGLPEIAQPTGTPAIHVFALGE
jgi:hypothetical protein